MHIAEECVAIFRYKKIKNWVLFWGVPCDELWRFEPGQ
jgi:hypothetical protein